MNDLAGDAVVYEVNLQVNPTRAAEYLDWLRAHIAEILALPGFVSAECWQVSEPLDGQGWRSLCVQYRLRDRAALDVYLRDHAPRLRADGVQRFGEDFRAQRRILTTLR